MHTVWYLTMPYQDQGYLAHDLSTHYYLFQFLNSFGSLNLLCCTIPEAGYKLDIRHQRRQINIIRNSGSDFNRVF